MEWNCGTELVGVIYISASHCFGDALPHTSLEVTLSFPDVYYIKYKTSSFENNALNIRYRHLLHLLPCLTA